MGNPRDVELDIVGHDKTRKATDSAGRNMERLKERVDAVSGSSRKMGKDGQVAGTALAESMKSAAATIRATGPVGAVAAIGAGLIALPTIAAAASAGIVLGLGGAIAGIGVAFAAQNKEVRNAWTKTKDHVVARLREMSAPFQPVLINIAKRARQTFDSFAPALEGAFQRMAPALDRFSVSFFRSLEKLKPAIRPLTDAFTTLLDRAGPRLPGLMQKITEAVQTFADVVKKNPNLLADLVSGLGSIISKSASVIAWLVRLGNSFREVWAAFKQLGGKIALGAQEIAVKINQMVAKTLEALARIPGPWQATFKKAAADARAGVQQSQRELNSLKTQDARNEVQLLQARIRSLQGKKVVTEADRAAIAASQARIRELQGTINSLQGKTIRVGTIFYQRGREPGTYGNGLGVYKMAAGDGGWNAVAAGGGRTQAPRTADTGPVNVATTVLLDGDPFRALVRNAVTDDRARAAHRARYGRRW